MRRYLTSSTMMFAQNASLAVLSFVPSVAYRFNEQWAVGVGVKAMYGMLQAQTAIDRSPFGLTDRSDGQFKYKDETWGFGANVGMIYAPQPATRNPAPAAVLGLGL